MGQIASRGVSVPEFLRKHIAICVFPGGGRAILSSALDPPMCTMGKRHYNTHISITQNSNNISQLDDSHTRKETHMHTRNQE